MKKAYLLLILFSYGTQALSEPMSKQTSGQSVGANRLASTCEKAREKYLKARNTFAGELLILKKLQDTTLDESEYLKAYLNLMELMLNRFKKDRYYFAFNDLTSYINLLIWGRNTLRIPLTQYVKLVDSTLLDIANAKILVLQAKRNLSLESKDRAEALHRDINALESSINELKTLAQNNQYDLEQKETHDYMITYIATLCVSFSASIAYGIMTTKALNYLNSPIYI